MDGPLVSIGKKGKYLQFFQKIFALSAYAWHDLALITNYQTPWDYARIAKNERGLIEFLEL